MHSSRETISGALYFIYGFFSQSGSRFFRNPFGIVFSYSRGIEEIIFCRVLPRKEELGYDEVTFNKQTTFWPIRDQVISKFQRNSTSRSYPRGFNWKATVQCDILTIPDVVCCSSVVSGSRSVRMTPWRASDSSEGAHSPPGRNHHSLV